MSITASVERIMVWTQGTLLQGSLETDIGGVSTDSRTLTGGELFVALVAERDGHEFIPKAVDLGASAILASDPGYSYPPGVAVILVKDTLQGLGDIASGWLALHRPKVVGVTGSNGKTSTKAMIAHILELAGETLRNEGNFNNLIGLPWTVFQLQPSHKFAVLEMGMNAPGEIARLAEIAKPDVGVITCVAAAHLEGVGSIEGVAKAKGELFDAMGVQQTAIVNADDPHIMGLVPSLKCKPVFFSKTIPASAEIPEGAASVTLKRLESKGADGFEFTANVTGLGELDVSLPLVGLHQVGNALAAIGAAYAAGVSAEHIQQGLAAVVPTGRRLRLSTTPQGVHLLDDCYNSNPSSCRAALETLKDLAKDAPSFAVLGDMLELGKGAEEAHAAIGAYAASIGVTGLFAFGPLAAQMAQGAREVSPAPTQVFHSENIDELWSALAAQVSPEAWVLVKGSRGMRLERISERLSAVMDVKRESNP